MKLTFKKNERLTGKTAIEEIFSEGKTVKKYPFVLKYLPYDFGPDEPPVKIVVSVPKRVLKKATQRNRVRRQIKEAYRLNKAELISEVENQEKGLALFLIYTGKEKPDYSLIEEKIKLLLKQVKQAD